MLGRQSAGRSGRENDVWLETDKLFCEGRKPIPPSLSPGVFDDQIPPLDVAELTEALTKAVDEVGLKGWRRVAQIPNRHGSPGRLPLAGERRGERTQNEAAQECAAIDRSESSTAHAFRLDRMAER